MSGVRKGSRPSAKGVGGHAKNADKGSKAPPVSCFSFCRTDFLICAGICAVYFAFRLLWLGTPAENYFDEVYYVPAANDYLALKHDSNWVHPPLGKEIAALFSLLWKGDPFFAMRLGPAFFGALTVGGVFLLGELSVGGRKAGLLAAFFAFFDFLLYAQSGIVTLDVFLTFFMLLSALFIRIALSFERDPDRERLFIVLSAVAAGLAGACKWSGVFSMFFAWFCILFLGCGGDLVRSLKKCLLFLAVFSVSYAAPYAYYFAIGGTFPELFKTFMRVLKFQYGSGWNHGYLSPMWKWVLMVRPVWYYFAKPDGVYSGIIAMGNPLFWWGFLVFFAVSVWRLVESRDRGLAFLLFGYLFSFVFWIASNRNGFFYYMLPAVPWMCLIASRSLSPLLGGKSAWCVWVYCSAIVVAFILYFPFLSGVLLPSSFPSKAYFRTLFFLRSWI